jgi:hypothetical protein
MKKQSRTCQKLALRKDTVRVLNQLDLAEVIAGQPTTTAQPTKIECQTLDTRTTTTC